MRKQQRTSQPTVLKRHGDRWNQQWIALRQRNPSASFTWYETEGKSAREWLLVSLAEMTQGHCAFCDAFPLADRSATPIEHFKPKSNPDFCQHAYDWDNLYYCCEVCQSHKLEKWDELLLRPDEPDYHFEIYFIFDFTTGAMLPNCSAEQNDQNRARVTIDLYGLDAQERRTYRRLELRKYSKSFGSILDEWAYRDFLELGSDTVPAI